MVEIEPYELDVPSEGEIVLGQRGGLGVGVAQIGGRRMTGRERELRGDRLESVWLSRATGGLRRAQAVRLAHPGADWEAHRAVAAAEALALLQKYVTRW